MEEERKITNRDYGYNEKVLVGNWLERRWEDHTNREMDLTTLYMSDYKNRPASHGWDTLWKNRLQGQGSIELKQSDDAGDIPSNMATVYDLAYRCKVKDFVTGDYDSVTNYGKKECKQNYWRSQTKDERSVRFHTEYKDSFSFTPCLTHLLN